MHNLQTLPDFSLINHEGKLVNIHEIKGQDKLIIFFTLKMRAEFAPLNHVVSEMPMKLFYRMA